MSTLIEMSRVTKIFGKKAAYWAEKSLEETQNSKGNSPEHRAEYLREHGHVLALDQVDLKVQKGEILAIVGLSGSGKSTLIRTLNRLIQPTTGSVRVEGKDLAHLSPTELQKLRQSTVSMVFQSFGLLPHKTNLENVAFGLKLQGVSKQARQASAMAWLERMELKDFAKHKPAQLSGGMRQRVGLARALITDPDIVLLDEPFSALDPMIRGRLQKLVCSLQAELKKTMIIITHDVNEAMNLADRIAVMHAGRLVHHGPPMSLLSNTRHPFIEKFASQVDRMRAVKVGHILSTDLAQVEPRGPALHKSALLGSCVTPLFESPESWPRPVVDDCGHTVGLLKRDNAIKALSSSD